MKASQRLTRQHQDLSEKGILLAFRHLKEPSPKVITFLKNYHLNNPHGLDGEVVVKPWESRLWGIINLALVEMQSHQAAELLAERLHAYFRDQVLPRGSLPARDRVLEAVGYFLQEHRDKNQSILVMERILTKSTNDDQTVFKLINRYCKPLCLSHSDVIGEFGTAPRWTGMELPLLIEHWRLLYRSGQSSPKLLSDPVYLLALFEISKLIVTRLVYPVLVTKVVAMLDSRQYSRRQAGTALLRIMHLVDSTGCRKYLKSMHVTPEVERRLSEILKVDFFRQ